MQEQAPQEITFDVLTKYHRTLAQLEYLTPDGWVPFDQCITKLGFVVAVKVGEQIISVPGQAIMALLENESVAIPHDFEIQGGETFVFHRWNKDKGKLEKTYARKGNSGIQMWESSLKPPYEITTNTAKHTQKDGTVTEITRNFPSFAGTTVDANPLLNLGEQDVRDMIKLAAIQQVHFCEPEI